MTINFYLNKVSSYILIAGKYFIPVIIFIPLNIFSININNKLFIEKYTRANNFLAIHLNKANKIIKYNFLQELPISDSVPAKNKINFKWNRPVNIRNNRKKALHNNDNINGNNRSLTISKGHFLQPTVGYFDVPDLIVHFPLQTLKNNTKTDSTGSVFFTFLYKYYNLHFFDSLINKINTSNIKGRITLNPQRWFGPSSLNLKLFSKGSDTLNCCSLLAIDSFRINLPTLGQTYTIDSQKLRLDGKHIYFNNFIITDTLRNLITVNGSVDALSSKATALNLNVNTYNLGLLQVNKAISNQIYGFAAVNATVNIGGTFLNPLITGDVEMKDNAALTIILPQNNLNKEVQHSVIRFINKDSIIETIPNIPIPAFKKKQAVKQLSLLDIKLQVKSAAALNFIIDPSAGDELNLHGESLLNAKLDSASNLLLYGLYKLDSGYYRLSNQYLQKKFELIPGSTITFSGAPGEALVDIKAVYAINTDAYDLLKNEIGFLDKNNLSALKKNLPFKVVLNLRGSIRNLKISFNILMDTVGLKLNSVLLMAIKNKLEQFMENVTATNKQVFSLLLYDRFVGEQSSDFFSNAGDVNINSFDKKAYESVSSFLSAAIDNIAEDLFKTLDIYHNLNNFKDYGNGDAQQKNVVNIGATKDFINDRLSLEVGKDYGIDGQDASAKAAQQKGIGFLPDVTLNYKFSKDGKYRYRSYKKNQFEITVDGNITESGISFLLNMDYDKFIDLLKKNSKKMKSNNE